MRRQNAFDQQLGYYYGDPHLNGFLSKIGRSIEKAVKKVNNVVKDNIRTPIAKATVPSSVRELGRKMDEKGVNKVIGAVAVSIFAPYAAGALVGASGAAAGTLAAKAITTGVGLAASQVSTAALKSGMQDYATVKATEQAMREESKVAAELAEAIAKVPEFQKVVDGLRAEGYTDAEIAAHWAESHAYYEAATMAAANTVYPAVLAEAETLGLPNPQAVAGQTAVYLAQQGVERVQAEAQAAAESPLQKLLPLAVIAGLALLGG
jgi:hypothetical protein